MTTEPQGLLCVRGGSAWELIPDVLVCDSPVVVGISACQHPCRWWLASAHVSTRVGGGWHQRVSAPVPAVPYGGSAAEFVPIPAENARCHAHMLAEHGAPKHAHRFAAADDVAHTHTHHATLAGCRICMLPHCVLRPEACQRRG